MIKEFSLSLLAVVCIGLSLVLFVWGAFGIITSVDDPVEISKVPCYDVNHNKIDGLICNEVNHRTAEYITLAIPAGLLLIIGFVIIASLNDLHKKKYW